MIKFKYFLLTVLLFFSVLSFAEIRTKEPYIRATLPPTYFNDKKSKFNASKICRNWVGYKNADAIKNTAVVTHTTRYEFNYVMEIATASKDSQEYACMYTYRENPVKVNGGFGSDDENEKPNKTKIKPVKKPKKPKKPNSSDGVNLKKEENNPVDDKIDDLVDAIPTPHVDVETGAINEPTAVELKETFTAVYDCPYNGYTFNSKSLQCEKEFLECKNGYELNEDSNTCECPAPKEEVTNKEGEKKCVVKPECPEDMSLVFDDEKGEYSCEKEDEKNGECEGRFLGDKVYKGSSLTDICKQQFVDLKKIVVKPKYYDKVVDNLKMQDIVFSDDKKRADCIFASQDNNGGYVDWRGSATCKKPSDDEGGGDEDKDKDKEDDEGGGDEDKDKDKEDDEGGGDKDKDKDKEDDEGGGDDEDDDEDKDKGKFCMSNSFFEKICNWIDWTKKKPQPPSGDPKRDYVDIKDGSKDLEDKFDRNLVKFREQCPPNKSINIQVFGVSKTLTYDHQPLCDAFIKLRPFVIGFGMIIGIMIVAGRRK